MNAALADAFVPNARHFKPFLRVMFSSEEFYSDAVIRNQVKSPVQWLIGTTRMLQCDLPPTTTCAAILRTLGQDLFAPPNVKGWDGGITWITTNTLLERYNAAATLVQGANQQVAMPNPTGKPGGTNAPGRRIQRSGFMSGAWMWKKS